MKGYTFLIKEKHRSKAALAAHLEEAVLELAITPLRLKLCILR